MIYNELIERGTDDFPIELYKLDKNHPRYEMSFHWHNEIELIRIIKGKLRLKLNNNEYLMSKSDVAFINPHTVHGAVPEGECIYECIVMKHDMIITSDNTCRFFIDGLNNHDFKVTEYSKDFPEEFLSSVNHLFDCLSLKSDGHKFMVIGALHSLFGIIINQKLLEADSGASKILEDKKLTKLKDILVYIRSNYDKALTLDEMAWKAGMSTKYFCSFFKKMTNKTPIEYLISYRIEKASRKLLNSNLSVTEIAYSCGFNDLSYFVKTFKKLKNVTPVKFRGK